MFRYKFVCSPYNVLLKFVIGQASADVVELAFVTKNEYKVGKGAEPQAPVAILNPTEFI